MSDLLERLKREDRSALEELGHELLPFIQAAVLAHSLEAKDPPAVLAAFRQAVRELAATAAEAAFAGEVLRRVREAAGSFAPIVPDRAQAEALACLQRLAPLKPEDRERVLGRFVERLPAQQLVRHFPGAELPAILARGVELLAGPAPMGGDWSSELALTEPDAVAPPQLIALENLLSALAIDVTALEVEPLKAPVPVLMPGVVVQAPVEHYPSQVKTHGLVDLPAAAAPVESTEVSGSPLVEGTEVSAPLTHQFPPLMDATEVAVPATRQFAPKAEDEDHTVLKGVPLPRAPIHPGWWWSSAAVCAVLGLGLYWGLVSRLYARTRSNWELTPVIVVTGDMSVGDAIAFDSVASRAVPSSFVSSSVVLPESVKVAIGQKLVVPLQAGDNLLWTQFESARQNERMSRRVTRQCRAYAIRVTEVKSVGGWLRPSERADLVLTLKNSTVTLLQDVDVLATGAVTNATVGRIQFKYTDVSLLLLPEEAEAVGLAQKIGELTLTMRPTSDHELLARREPATIDLLLSAERAKVIERKREEIIKFIRR